METKRCQRCHKLLRIDAQMCSRCGGHAFLQGTHARGKQTGNLTSKEMVSIHSNHLPSRPSSPPPSPHRAGHYSGLHPEDQPYQSSFLPAVGTQFIAPSPVSTKPALEEPDDLSFSTEPDESLVSVPVPAPKRHVASLSPLPLPGQQRSAPAIQSNRAPMIEQDETERDLEVAYFPVPPAFVTDPQPLTITTRPPRRRRQGHLVPILLITSCFLFLLATSILAFLLANNKPAPVLTPHLFAEPTSALSAHDTLLLSGSGFQARAMVTITRDGNIPVLDESGAPLQVQAFNTGNFSVQITIPESWAAGPHTINATDSVHHSAHILIMIRQPSAAAPNLRLETAQIDLGADSAGAVSHRDITLINTGGGLLPWQGSSDHPWLTLNPTSWSFGGSESVTITVDRSNLAPQSYTGHIFFTQQGSENQPLKLTVTMSVNAALADLALSPASFTFQGTTVQNPAGQPITIQNSGGQSLNWTAFVSTVSGGNWLSLSNKAGNLSKGGQATMVVSANSAGLSAGAYQGTVTFSYAGAASTPVSVTLIVNPPPVPGLSVQPGGLAFKAIQGQNPSSQSFTISNTGSAPLNWGIVEDSNGQAYVQISQSHGTLTPSKSIVITVSPSISQVSASVLTALLTVMDTDAGTPVKNQQVKVTITIVNQALISLDRNQFNFSNTGAIPVSTQLFTITNTGSTTLNWSITITNTLSVPWLTVDISNGVLGPNAIDLINVTCDSTHLSPGTFTATLTVQDTDHGTPVTPQTITVVLVVTP